MNAVPINTKIGDIELSTPASALSTYCSPHANSVHAAILLKNPWTSSRRQVDLSFGNRAPWCHMIASRNTAAITTRIAISVIGGIVATATLINKYDEPHRQASIPNNANSIVRLRVFSIDEIICVHHTKAGPVSVRQQRWRSKAVVCPWPHPHERP